MRKEYDLNQLKVKRRGPLSGLSGVPEAPEAPSGDVVQVTLMLDKDITAFFEREAHRSKDQSFAKQVNQALRHYIEECSVSQ